MLFQRRIINLNYFVFNNTTAYVALEWEDNYACMYWAGRESGVHIKKTQLDAQLILSIFRQPLHVSGVSRPIIRRYNRMYTTIGPIILFR